MKHVKLIRLLVCGVVVFCAWCGPWAARLKAQAPRGAAAAPAGQKGNEEDGPPINLTCVGLAVPATVHVSALPPRLEGVAGPATPQAVAAAPLESSPLAYSYVWDFGDPQGRYNQLPGWNAAHVYDKPGKYTITLTVTDASGKKTHRTSWVRVGPDARNRVYVSAAGSDQFDGSSPARAVRTVWRAMQLAPSNAVVLFRRGDRFDVAHQMSINGRNLRLTNYDDAAGRSIGPPGSPKQSDLPPEAVGEVERPVLNKVAGPPGQDVIFYVNPKSSDVTFDGLEFDSQWSLKGSGLAKPWEKIPARAINAGGTNCTVRDCSFRNLTDCVNAELKPTGLLVQDCRFSNEVRGYGIYGCGTDHAYVGNVMLHSRTEHLIRCTEPGVDRLLIAYNDLYRPNNGKGSIELRNANWFYVSDNLIDGGSVRVGPQEQDQSRVPTWKSIKCTWGVVQNNRLDNVFFNIRLGTEHVVYRNNYVHLKGDKEGEWAFFVACEKPGFDQVRKVIDVRLEHNTVVNDGTIGQFVVVQGHPLGMTLCDNLFVAPKLRTVGDRGWSVFLFDKDLSGFARVSGNVWPAGPGGLHHWAKADHGREDWAQSNTAGGPVSGERYLNVSLDEDGNPPPGLNTGAQLPKKPAARHTRGEGPWDELPRRDEASPAGKAQ